MLIILILKKKKTNELRDSGKKSILLNKFIICYFLAQFSLVLISYTNMFITRIYCGVLFGLLFGE